MWISPNDLRTSTSVSFEFYPPKTEKGEESLWSALRRLEPLGPDFVSVTYGAGGSTRERTHAIVKRILDETDTVPAAHLTCVEASRDEVNEVADAYWDAGVRHIVALRGDLPSGEGRFTAHPDGYDRASSLVGGLRRRHDFEISVAAYPGGHPESPSLEADLDNLKQKIDAGATRAITQFFFDNREFLQFRERAGAAGISVPITPGIMPVSNVNQTIRFAEKCGIEVPSAFRSHFDGLDEDPRARDLVSIAAAADQVRELAGEGVTSFHFYTLNRAELVFALCHILGLRPRQTELAAAG